MEKRLIYIILPAFVFLLLTGCKNGAVSNGERKTYASTGITSSGEESIIPMESAEAAGNKTSDAEMANTPAETGAGTGSEGTTETEKKGFPITLKDMLGNEIKIAKRPEKIAVLSAELLEMLYKAGGASICSVEPENGEKEPDGTGELPKVGKASKPDIVSILELEPDLVFAVGGTQNETISLLQKSGLTVVAMSTDSKERRTEALSIMKKAAGLE